jgi:hypothetical protein
MMTPLAFASIGWQLDLSAVAGHGVRLALGLGYKLLAAPAAALGVLMLLHPSLTLADRVVVAQCAMPPMVTAAVLAGDSRLDGPLAASMVAVGLLVGPLTVGLWWWLTGLL